MPIRPKLRPLYPSHWRDLSARVRFKRAGGMCQGCERPHLVRLRRLPDGRWIDEAFGTWRDRRGGPAHGPTWWRRHGCGPPESCSSPPTEAIAARAGVSKVTLYTHYSDKAALFRAAVGREMERIEAGQRLRSIAGGQGPVADQFRNFGLGILGFLTSKSAIDFYAVIARELRRHEGLARAFYDLSLGRTRANLVGLISAAAERGELSVADPEHAADELFSTWQGFTNFQMSLGIDIDAIRRDLPDRVERAGRAFMQAYGVERSPGPDRNRGR